MHAHPPVRFRPAAAVLILCIAAGTAASARAQNALGDGSMAGANAQLMRGNQALRLPGGQVYQQRFGSVVPRWSFDQDIAFRNAVVTGNVGGGFDFRGELGYTAADDFRGELGSDDIFDFQRRSMPAPSAAMLGRAPVRGQLTPAQIALGYTVSGQSVELGGSPIVRRPGAGFSSAQVIGAPQEQIPSMDVFARVQGGLRAPSAYEQRTSADPFIVGGFRSPDEETIALLSSGLYGVKSFTLDTYQDTVQSRDERIRERLLPSGLTLAPRPAEADEVEAEEPDAPPPLGAERVDARQPVIATAPESYNRLVETLRIRAERAGTVAPPTTPTPVDPASPEATTPPGQTPTTPQPPTPIDPLTGEPRLTFEEQLRELREHLSGVAATPSLPYETLPPLGAGDDDAEPEPNDGEPAVETPVVEPSHALDPVNRARDLLGLEPVDINQLTDPAKIDSLFAEHLAAGERALTEGRWFDAEERFTAALLAYPGDPMASAGRVIAQTAAGLHMSAALNLETMLKAYPELALARFDESLLPPGERRAFVLSELRRKIGIGGNIGSAAGLLLAYMGFQFDDPVNVRDGLEAFEQNATGDPARTSEVAGVLRALWAPDGEAGADD